MPDAVRSPRSRWKRPYWIAALLIVVLALAPILGAIGADAIGEAAGCQVDEGSVHPCVINGVDVGDTLTTLFVLGWLGMVTLPFGAGALILLAGAFLIHFGVRRSRAAKP